MLKKIVAVVIALVVLGLILYAVDHYLPIDPWIRRLIQFVVVVGLILAGLFWLYKNIPADAP